MMASHKILNKDELYALKGKTVTIVDVPDAYGYEPTAVIIEVDGKKYALTADTVHYDQYSSDPCLTIYETD